MKVLCLSYPAQDRVINFEKFEDGLSVEIKSKKRVIAYILLNKAQCKEVRSWIMDNL
jgi:hypothetical protein